MMNTWMMANRLKHRKTSDSAFGRDSLFAYYRVLGGMCEANLKGKEISDSASLTARKRRKVKDQCDDPLDLSIGFQPVDYALFALNFPVKYEPDLVCGIFELGLKHSSPKVVMQMMGDCPQLNTEHIKSHLQKYRIHHERSKGEFLVFYNDFMRDSFNFWISSRGWECSDLMDVPVVDRPKDTFAPGQPFNSDKRMKIGIQSKSEVLFQQTEQLIADWRGLYEENGAEYEKMRHFLRPELGETTKASRPQIQTSDKRMGMLHQSPESYQDVDIKHNSGECSPDEFDDRPEI